MTIATKTLFDAAIHQLSNVDIVTGATTSTFGKFLTDALDVALNKIHQNPKHRVRDAVCKLCEEVYPYDIAATRRPFLHGVGQIHHYIPNLVNLRQLFSKVSDIHFIAIDKSLTPDDVSVFEMDIPEGYDGYTMHVRLSDLIAGYGYDICSQVYVSCCKKEDKDYTWEESEFRSVVIPPHKTSKMTVYLDEDGGLQSFHAGRYFQHEFPCECDTDRMVALLGKEKDFNFKEVKSETQRN